MNPLEFIITSHQFLLAATATQLIGLFWIPLIGEIPRYFFGCFGALNIYLQQRIHGRALLDPRTLGKVSVLIPGHNEADSIEKCVRSLREQSFQDFEIVCVSDGSTDETYAIMQRLQQQGLVDKIAGCHVRGGKSSGINLGMRLASGDIVVVIDCDCSFERNALEELLQPFADPAVGAVSGSILVRNADVNVLTSLQFIEFLIGMVLGRVMMDMMNQLPLISGAFGAFRRTAFMQVNGMDPGPGEDGDVTLRLRHAGYKIRFAAHSIGYTDVPTAFFNLMRQRNRWERDALWIRYRKHRRIYNPFRQDFQLKEAFHQLDFMILTILPTFIFPIYMVYVLTTYGELAAVVILAITFGLLALDVCTFLFAVIALGKYEFLRFLPFLLIYGLWQCWIMRMVRLYAFTLEWIYSTSRGDNFAPPKVNAWIRWK